MYKIRDLFDLAISQAISKTSSKKGQKKIYGSVQDIEPIIPQLPPAGKAPYIYVCESNFGVGFKKLLNSEFCSDTKFLIYDAANQVEREILGHQLILTCVQSKVIRELFEEILLCRDKEYKYSDEAFQSMCEKVNSGRVSGFSSISLIQKEDNSTNQLELKLSNTIQYDAFYSLMEVLYCGHSETLKNRKNESKFINQVKMVATIFECDYLENIATNYESGSEEVFNESLETYLNDLLGDEIKKRYFDNATYSDVEIVFNKATEIEMSESNSS